MTRTPAAGGAGRPWPGETTRGDPSSPEAYRESCRRLAERHFAGLSLAEIQALEEEFNAYPGLEGLEPPHSLMVLEGPPPAGGEEKVRRAVLEGRIFWEHLAAGEGTRLGLGPKYLLNPGLSGPNWTLGDRHLGQWAFEMSRLAQESGLDPAWALARQTLLLVVSRAGRDLIIERVRAANFLGLEPDRFLFLEQAEFPALRPEGGWHFAEWTTPRLHNHGHLAMQMTMDGQIFHLDRAGRETRLSREDFFNRLSQAENLATYSIEDLGYLARALDFEALALALDSGEKGFRMVMEIVPNHPDRPVKGAMLAHDPALGRDVMIESLGLRGRPPEQISLINKNFNHYPRPAEIFLRLSEAGLFLPVTVKEDGLYFQPVRGDINFLVPTAFFTRRPATPLAGWKTAADTPAALAALKGQDAQPGFAEFMAALFEERKGRHGSRP